MLDSVLWGPAYRLERTPESYSIYYLKTENLQWFPEEQDSKSKLVQIKRRDACWSLQVVTTTEPSTGSSSTAAQMGIILGHSEALPDKHQFW